MKLNLAIHVQFWPRTSTHQTKHCTKKTSVLLLLTTRNGQSTIAIKSLQEKSNKPWDFSIVLLGTNTILVKNLCFHSQISVALLFSAMESMVNKDIYTHIGMHQCRAMKFILNHLTMNLKTRLEQLQLLPLMYTYY